MLLWTTTKEEVCRGRGTARIRSSTPCGRSKETRKSAKSAGRWACCASSSRRFACWIDWFVAPERPGACPRTLGQGQFGKINCIRTASARVEWRGLLFGMLLHSNDNLPSRHRSLFDPQDSLAVVRDLEACWRQGMSKGGIWGSGVLLSTVLEGWEKTVRVYRRFAVRVVDHLARTGEKIALRLRDLQTTSRRYR
jgi:hypothetical protein